MKKSDEQKPDEDLKIVPYLQVDGVWTFRDSEIKAFYLRIMEESSHVFKDGSIKTPEEFLHELKYNPDNQLYVPLLGDDPVGLVWFNRFQYTFAQGHFCAFKKYWGNLIVAESGKKALQMFFKYNDCYTVIGILPGSNTKALNVMLRIGARIVGVLTDVYVDLVSGSLEEAVICQVKRDDYEDLP